MVCCPVKQTCKCLSVCDATQGGGGGAEYDSIRVGTVFYSQEIQPSDNEIAKITCPSVMYRPFILRYFSETSSFPLSLFLKSSSI